MERRVEMGIYGSLVSIVRSKNRTISVKIADVVVKNRAGEFLLSKLNAKFDVVLTNYVRLLD